MKEVLLNIILIITLIWAIIILIWSVKNVVIETETGPIIDKYMLELRYGHKEYIKDRRDEGFYISTKNYLYFPYISNKKERLGNSGSISVYRKEGYSWFSSQKIYGAGWGSSSHPTGFKKARKVFVGLYEKHTKQDTNNEN